MIRIFCDGGARGNPGPAAWAFVVELDKKIIHKASDFIGRATNNVAEYRALTAALSWLSLNLPKTDAQIILDSELVVKQMSGIFKIKNENLRNYFFEAKDLEKKIGAGISYKAVTRNKNILADFLVNKTLDSSNENI